MGIFIVTNKESKEEVIMTCPPNDDPQAQKFDLLDLLDRKTWLPKDRKVTRRHAITLLDIMDPPVTVLNEQIAKEEVSKKENEAMDLVTLLDRKTGQRRKGLLDVMDPPVVKDDKEKEKVKSMDLVDFLDSKTRLPKKEAGAKTVRRRIGLLGVMDAPTPSVSEKKDQLQVDLMELLDPKTRLPRDSRGLPGRRQVNILDILESGEKR